jgi:hypothetical protein
MVESAAENPEYCRTFCKSEVFRMPRPRLQVPGYRKHSTGRAVVSIYRAHGLRTEIMLPGPYGSDESKQEYERILALLRANGGTFPEKNSLTPDLTIAELIARFMAERVATYYVNHETKEMTGEVENFASAMRPVNRLFGSWLAAEFSPHCLITVRQSMIDGSWMSDDERENGLKKAARSAWPAARSMDLSDASR